jgi:hypothetical protein
MVAVGSGGTVGLSDSAWVGGGVFVLGRLADVGISLDGEQEASIRAMINA